MLIIPTSTPGGRNAKLKKVNLKNEYIWYLQRMPFKSKRNSMASYAVLFACGEDLETLWTNDVEKLHFKIIAKHGLSSFVRVKTIHFYHKESDIVEGKFSHGKMLNIVPCICN